MEKFKVIYNNYKVGDRGTVVNILTGAVVSTNVGASGYHRLKLRIKGKRKSFNLYSLVGNAFVENLNPDINYKLSFKDGNKLNYLPENLYWTNAKEINSKNKLVIPTGKIVHNFTVLEEISPEIYKGRELRKFKCRCVCGTIRYFTPSMINRKVIPDNCGCILPDIIPLDIDAANKKYPNEYRYISEELFSVRKPNGEIKRKVKTICKKCSKVQKVFYENYIEGGKASGCWDCMFEDGVIGNSNGENSKTHGMSSTRIYRIYRGMLQRINDLNHKDYKRYGGRGIEICKEWSENFMSFYHWSMDNGYADNLEIDRENNDGNYNPDNCRWVHRIVNSRNQSNTKLSIKKAKEIRNSSKSIKELAEYYNVSTSTIESVLKNKTWIL